MMSEDSGLRYPLFLTLYQLNALAGLLDAATASEADPDAPNIVLLDHVREVRKQAMASGANKTLQHKAE